MLGFIKEIGWSFRPHEPSSLVEKQARRSRKIENKIKKPYTVSWGDNGLD